MTDWDWSALIVWFCLVAAEAGDDRTVYSSRIDGLILPRDYFWPY